MDSDARGGLRIQLALAGVFVLVVIGGVIDLVLDAPHTLLTFHVGFEVLLVILSLSAATYLARGWYSSQARLARSEIESARLAREREEWRGRAAGLLHGLGEEISRQFEEWGLTSTERRVALMLLQGLSHKRIARVTETSERTVRQHSVAIYRKSGLAGRAGLSGFFLEPLILPEDSRESGTP